MSPDLKTTDLTLRGISPDLAEILDNAHAHGADPSGMDAFTSDWLISETMRDDPTLTRGQAIAIIRQAEAEAAAGGL